MALERRLVNMPCSEAHGVLGVSHLKANSTAISKISKDATSNYHFGNNFSTTDENEAKERILKM